MESIFKKICIINTTTTMIILMCINISFGQINYLNPYFGIGGKVITTFGNETDQATSMAMQPDGKRIVVSGRTQVYGNYCFAIARYNNDGSLDASFGINGKVIIGFGTDDWGFSVIVQPDGKIVVGGRVEISDNYNFGIVRLKANGSIDSTFNGTGKIITDFGNNDVLYELTLQSDGKILASGVTYNCSAYKIAIARYNIDGTLDNSFSGDGKLITNINNNYDGCSSIQVQNDGKIVICGSSYPYGSSSDLAIVRYLSNGDLDYSFGNGGTVITDINGGSDVGYEMKIQPNGKIVAIGTTNANSIFLARFNTDGTLDLDFNNTGKTLLNCGSSEGCSLEIHPDGKILITGKTFINNYDFLIARFNYNGTLDQTFGTNGILTTDFSNHNDYGYKIILTDGGSNFIAAGWSNNGTNDDFAIAKYIYPQSTSIYNINEKNNYIKITSNQSESSIKISFPNSNHLPCKLTITDITGKLVTSKINIYDEEINYNYNNLRQGIYIISISGGEQTLQTKWFAE